METFKVGDVVEFNQELYLNSFHTKAPEGTFKVKEIFGGHYGTPSQIISLEPSPGAHPTWASAYFDLVAKEYIGGRTMREILLDEYKPSDLDMTPKEYLRAMVTHLSIKEIEIPTPIKTYNPSGDKRSVEGYIRAWKFEFMYRGENFTLVPKVNNEEEAYEYVAEKVITNRLW